MNPIPTYHPPAFDKPPLANAPAVRTVPAPADGVAPDGFHATSIHPEYVHLGEGRWLLARESRMDAVLVLQGDQLDVCESRRLRAGDAVVVGRSENGEDGIYVHCDGFSDDIKREADKFAFRTRGTRETPFSRSYDELYQILRHDREYGHIVWVLGPAIAFDQDSRQAMQGLIESGYCHAVMAGNALATHDLEAALFRTGLGQDIYTQSLRPQGHYNHLDVLNQVRRLGSVARTIGEVSVEDGILWACERRAIPYVLAGSIRDDGPLPEVITEVTEAQDKMRQHARVATTVLALATQLHAIAFGNMLPSYRVMPDDSIRPVFFYVVDIAEFSADKLANRGSTQAQAILTNAQDFVVNLWHNLQ